MPASPIADLPRPLAIVAHDAGAANLILPWLDPVQPGLRAVMEGPARALWNARFGEMPTWHLDDALEGAAAVLSGTGWASDLEHRARHGARERGAASIAVIDHWVNYLARFDRNGETVLPDAIWVTDEYAFALARGTFDLPVVLQPNDYLAEQVAVIGEPVNPRAALYVLEPARSDWGRSSPGEFQALDWFMAGRAALDMTPDDPVILRPHPSDVPGKYDTWIAAHPSVTLDRSTGIGEAIGRAGLVVGLNSHAMVVALAAGRRVVCTLPPWAPPCVLPHAGIERLSE